MAKLLATEKKYCRADSSTLLKPLTCWLPRSVLTRGFLDNQVTALFAVYNFRKKSPLRLILFSKYSKFNSHFWNSEKNWENIFRFLEKCISIGCVKQSLLLREDTFHLVSICWQTVSRFQILLRQNFLSRFFFIMIRKYGKNTAKQIKQCFGPLIMLTAHKCSRTWLSRHLSNSPFCCLLF